MAGKHVLLTERLRRVKRDQDMLIGKWRTVMVYEGDYNQLTRLIATYCSLLP